jgi:lipoate-protein ligase B
LRLVELGRAAYVEVEARQEELRAALQAGAGEEVFLLCEHDPVITLGRAARRENVLASADQLAARGVTLAPSRRGGDVTYHGPGQLVGYPVVRLTRGVLHHVESMAAAIVGAVGAWGVDAAFRRDCPGVWVAGAKLAAFGVHVSRGVAIHGFALNVTTALEDFGLIVPCGLAAARVTSLARLVPEVPGQAELGREIAGRFATLTGRVLIDG